MELVVEVVTYDPIRRKGFMKALESTVHLGKRVHFALDMLPKQFRQNVIEESRRLNRARKQPIPQVEFKKLMHQIRTLVVGQQFSLQVRIDSDAMRIVRKSVKHLPRDAKSPRGEAATEVMVGSSG